MRTRVESSEVEWSGGGSPADSPWGSSCVTRCDAKRVEKVVFFDRGPPPSLPATLDGAEPRQDQDAVHQLGKKTGKARALRKARAHALQLPAQRDAT